MIEVLRYSLEPLHRPIQSVCLLCLIYRSILYVYHVSLIPQVYLADCPIGLLLHPSAARTISINISINSSIISSSISNGHFALCHNVRIMSGVRATTRPPCVHQFAEMSQFSLALVSEPL